MIRRRSNKSILAGLPAWLAYLPGLSGLPGLPACLPGLPVTKYLTKNIDKHTVRDNVMNNQLMTGSQNAVDLNRQVNTALPGQPGLAWPGLPGLAALAAPATK